MRVKYKKGLPPELILAHLANYMEENLIGTVNVYIQEYDENMKAIKDDSEYLILEPGEKALSKYKDYVARQRRKRIKAV